MLMLTTGGFRATTIAALAIGAGGLAGSAAAQTSCNSVGADVIVGELVGTDNAPSNGGIESFAIGTTSCNIGDTPLLWIANTNQHPVIGQNFYRLKDGRFDHIGQSWLKHGFFALQNDACGCGCNPTASDRLGVGCSDPYGAGLNGDGPELGPKYQINAHTGAFSYPFDDSAAVTPNIGRRLQVAISDIDPAQNGGGLYFAEGHYVSPDDAAAGNQNNNASYIGITVSGSGSSWSFSTSGSTQREQPGIRAWQDTDPSVTETDIQIPGEGLLIVASNATDNGDGTWHYEYAVQNLNSDRSVGEFRVPCGAGIVVTNLGFNAPGYHSGEPWDNTPWTGQHLGNEVIWSTDDFNTDQSANALRWGTMYTFRFDANIAPDSQLNDVDLGLFKPGTPSEVSGAAQTPPASIGPQDCNNNGTEDQDDIANGTSQDCNSNLIPDECETFPECDLTTELIASNLGGALYAVAPTDDLDRLFVVRQGGLINIVDLNSNTVLGTPFLDIDPLTNGSGERGLLSMAFDPDYDTNGFFYVNYTNLAGNTVIARYTVSGDPDVADAGSALILKTINQDFANHNGGQIQFGPDGYLYVGMGDGGSANDPNQRAQNLNSLLGKMLRLDVDNPPTYVAPGNLQDEIWALGLRNPWRFHFDRLTGDLWIADVGQDAREEIDFLAAGTAAGANFGWRCKEGTFCTGLSGCSCADGSLIDPIKEEFHSDGITCSITGGYVYRGCDIPWMHGRYFYSDVCGNYFRSFLYDAATDTVSDERDHTADFGSLFSTLSFGEDAAGEMYILSNGGDVRKIICDEPVVQMCGNGTIEAPEECDPPNGINCDCNCELIDGTAIYADNFETDTGWVTSNNSATSGDWQRGTPVDDPGWQYDPSSDGDGSGQCYLTQNENGNTDVDNGSVTLRSPQIDMSAGDVVIEYDYFLRLTDTDGSDRILTEISSNGAAGPWTTIATHATDGGLSWRHATIDQTMLSDAGVTLGSNMMVRFTANDSGTQSIVEAGVDGFTVSTFSDYSDCNLNCINDADEIADGSAFDCNDNGIPDECEAGGKKMYPIAVKPPLDIPDGAGTFVSHDFVVTDSGTILDLDLGVVINHTWNGDLTVRLSHGGVTAVVIDRPGFPNGDPNFGWDNDGFDIILDDEGGTSIEDFDSGGPAVTSPPSYIPANPLAVFDGMDKNGLWTIEVSDAVTQDAGVLASWELRIVNSGSSISPCDCNNNGVDDSVDITEGTSLDCNFNNTPDECDIAADPTLDCAGGPIGVIDDGDFLINTFCFGCHNTDGSGGAGFPGPNIRNRSRVEIWTKLLPPTDHPGGAFPSFTDQDFADLEAFLADGGSRGRPDRVLDNCQTDLPDCDNDGTSDACELEAGTQTDADYDGVPDECGAPCPWDCEPPGGNGFVNFDDLVAVVNAISTQDLACDVAPDNGDGTFGNGVITFDDLIAVINNFGACP